MSLPLYCKALVALILATAKVALLPLSVKVNKVFGDPSASLIVNTPFVPAVAKVTTGVPLESVNGLAPDA